VWDTLLAPWGLHITITPKDEIWVCGSSRVKKPDGKGWLITPPDDQWVLKLNPAGEVLSRVPLPLTKTPPGQPSEVSWVHAIAVDSQGNVYLGDIQGKRAQKFVVQRP